MTAPEVAALLLFAPQLGPGLPHYFGADPVASAAVLVLSMAIISSGGWVWETVLCSLIERRVVRRGFLYGPSCPIYGIGATVIYLVLGWSSSPLVVFALGAAIATGIELATGTFLERRFGRRWWDYSGWPLNYRGHVCAAASAVFGLFAVLTVFVIEPALIASLTSLGELPCIVAATVVTSLYALDLLATVYSVDDGARRRISTAWAHLSRRR